MKKLLFIAMLLGFSTGAFSQVLKLVNNLPCDILVEIKAEDFTHLPCTLESVIFTVPALSSIAFPNVPAVNGWPGWLGGALAGPGGIWDAVKFSIVGGGGGMVGASCGAGIQWGGFDCTGAPASALWTPGGGGNVTVNWF